jgi:hypothetical protein
LISKEGDKIADNLCNDLGIKYSKTFGSFSMRPDTTVEYRIKKIDQADRKIRKRDGITNWYELDAERMAKQEEKDVERNFDDENE